MGVSFKELIRPFYLRWVYFRLFPRALPPSFAACWRYPEAHSEELCAAACGDIVFYPMTDWHSRRQRSEQLARALAQRGFRCFLLNPHLGRQFPRTFGPDVRVTRLEERVFELHVRLPSEPVFHHRLLSAAESEILSAAVAATLARAGASHVVQIVSLPIFMAAAGRLPFPVVYDCHDLLAGLPGMAPEIVAAEPAALDRASLALFSSADLAARYARLGGRALLLRNGVDLEAVPEGAPASQRVAGYVGALEEWFDTDAVRAAALAHPDCRFVLAGRVQSAAVKTLGALANVELVGEVPPERLAQTLARFRVGLIPFRVNALTRAANPIKLYEYFRCGLPVVTAPLDEVCQFTDLVYPAANPAEFARQVGIALEEARPEAVKRRQEIAQRESWAARAAQLTEVLPFRPQ